MYNVAASYRLLEILHIYGKCKSNIIDLTAADLKLSGNHAGERRIAVNIKFVRLLKSNNPSTAVADEFYSSIQPGGTSPWLDRTISLSTRDERSCLNKGQERI